MRVIPEKWPTKWPKTVIEKIPLYPFVAARSVMFTAESLLGPLIDVAISRKRPRLPTDDPELFQAARASLEEILRRDVENIQNGVYPVDVLMPESPLKHILRIPKMFLEGWEIARRRREHKSKEFSETARALLDDPDVPDYYKRNFHYQGDGYLSEESAELYEHQVEVLFAGAADAMRRLILAPMRKHFGTSDGEGLKFLELGAGTGRTTKFVRLAFPKAKIVAVDLSSPYLKRAQDQLRNFARHDFLEADAAKLPFLDETFDAVYSVFLFHELPMEARKKVVAEGIRVLKQGGYYGLVDSLQLGDVPRFDSALERFPVEFHEPFYANYVKNPIEHVLKTHGLEDLSTQTGFFSKVVSSRKELNEASRS